MTVPRSYHDITRILRPGIAPWPGDTPFQFQFHQRMADGAAVNVGALATSTHNGTHVDAPLHFQADGVDVARLDLTALVGSAFVLDVSAAGSVVTQAHLAAALAGLPRANFARLLLKTGAWADDASFPDRFPVIAPDVPVWLGTMGVRLLGVDVPSVDCVESQDLSSHHALFAAGIVILESLDLSAVEQGLYELIALPLKIAGADAAPARAILREIM